MIKRVIVRIFMVVMSLSQVAHASLELVITEGVNSARPIGIVPFKWEGTGKLPEDIAAVVASDLQRSGKFNPIATSKMPQTPYSDSDIDFSAWNKMGVDSLVTPILFHAEKSISESE